LEEFKDDRKAITSLLVMQVVISISCMIVRFLSVYVVFTGQVQAWQSPMVLMSITFCLHEITPLHGVSSSLSTSNWNNDWRSMLICCKGFCMPSVSRSRSGSSHNASIICDGFWLGLRGCLSYQLRSTVIRIQKKKIFLVSKCNHFFLFLVCKNDKSNSFVCICMSLKVQS